MSVCWWMMVMGKGEVLMVCCLGQGPRNVWWGLELPPLLVKTLLVEQLHTCLDN